MRWWQPLVWGSILYYLIWGSLEVVDWIRTQRRLHRNARLWEAIEAADGGFSEPSSAARGVVEPRDEGIPLPAGPSSGPSRTYSEKWLIATLGQHGEWVA